MAPLHSRRKLQVGKRFGLFISDHDTLQLWARRQSCSVLVAPLLTGTATLQIQYKAKAKRLQKEVDLEAGPGSRNYNPNAPDASKLRRLKLEGSRVDMRSDLALMTIKCGVPSLVPPADWIASC